MANVLGGHPLWVDKKVQNREVVIFFRSNLKLFYTHVFAFPPLKNVKMSFSRWNAGRQTANSLNAGHVILRSVCGEKKIGSALRNWDQ